MAEPLEPLHYRARKWFLQQATPLLHSSTQHQRLLETDWDVLLVIDACRLDTLRSVGSWSVQEEISPASNTGDWIRAAAKTGILEDTTLVTANPQYRKDEYPDVGTRDFVDISESKQDSRLETVLPEPVLERVGDELCNESPVVGHLAQPHAPYIHRIGETWIDGLGTKWQNREFHSTQVSMTRGRVNPERAKQAYRASVKSICKTLEPYVETWVNEGHHVVVTSDHGEVFGEIQNFGMVEHPHRCFLPDLVRVPFVEFVPPLERQAEPRDALQALGYVE